MSVICDDFKAVYRVDDREAGEQDLQDFCKKWQSSYSKITKSLIENPYLVTFYNFPESLRRSIYSTNLIESFNKQMKKYTKRKEQFPNEEALERFFVTQFE